MILGSYSVVVVFLQVDRSKSMLLIFDCDGFIN